MYICKKRIDFSFLVQAFRLLRLVTNQQNTALQTYFKEKGREEYVEKYEEQMLDFCFKLAEQDLFIVDDFFEVDWAANKKIKYLRRGQNDVIDLDLFLLEGKLSSLFLNPQSIGVNIFEGGEAKIIEYVANVNNLLKAFKDKNYSEILYIIKNKFSYCGGKCISTSPFKRLKNEDRIWYINQFAADNEVDVGSPRRRFPKMSHAGRSVCKKELCWAECATCW